MEKKYIPIENVYLFLYNDNNFLCFLNDNNEIDIFNNTILPLDNGSIFSIARYMNCNFNIFNEDFYNLMNKKDIKKVQLKKEVPNYHLWSEKTYNFWLNKLSKNIIQYDEIPKTVIYFIEIKNIDINYLNTITSFNFLFLNNFEINKKYSQKFQFILNSINYDLLINHINQTIKNKDNLEKYLILSCKTPGPDQVGFFHFPALFHSLYRKNTDYFKYLVSSVDELPNDEELKSIKCIIIPGSNLNVNDKYEFLRKTEKFLKNIIDKIYKKELNIKLLGICFGMQIIINCLGGKILSVGRGKHRGIPEDIEIDDKFYEYNFVKKSGIEKKKILRICEAHGDYIDEFDQNMFTLLGKSNSCKCEILIDKMEKIFLIQGHPEYNPDFTINRAAPFFVKMMYNLEPTDENIKNYIKKELSNEMSKNVNILEYRKLCYTFMKN